MLGFKPTYSLFSFTFIKRLFSSSSLSNCLNLPFGTQGRSWRQEPTPKKHFRAQSPTWSCSVSFSQNSNSEIPKLDHLLESPGELFKKYVLINTGLSGGSVVKNPPANTGDVGWIPGSRRSSRTGNGNQVQYS